MSCLNFTVIPLRLATFFGTVFSAAGFVGALVVFIRKLLDPSIAIGWSSLMCAFLVLFGICFLMLGIIGEYIGKLILNINKTPQYVVRETRNVKKAAETGTSEISDEIKRPENTGKTDEVTDD